MEKLPILSICIPTDGSVKWLLPVLDSIYSQDVNQDLFEVVITDNGQDSQIPLYIRKYNYSNLRYKQTNDSGFMNLVSALKDGNGVFCKMLNHRSVLHPGTIEKWIEMIKQYKETKPIIYCADANVKGADIIECKNIDEFLINLSVYTTWSAGIGFWKEDIQRIDSIKIDEMYPNTSMLLNIRENAKYVIWNYKYQTMEDGSGKGGYDYFQTFAVRFLDIINLLRIQGRIRNETFSTLKWDMYKFLNLRYLEEVLLPTKHTYLLTDIKSSFNIYYGEYYYWKMVFNCIINYPYNITKHWIRKFHRLLKNKQKYLNVQ